MKKKYFVALSLILIAVLLFGCNPEQSSNNKEEQAITEETDISDTIDEPGDTGQEFVSNSDELAGLYNNTTEKKPETGEEVKNIGDSSTVSKQVENFYYSPFTGQVVDEMNLRKALLVVVENSPAARPQSGLGEASIVYEVLVEGGITRFLALYWNHIPEKIGPVRSARPYIINIAKEYNGLLLHAGASPEGFAMLSEGDLEHLDQIYKSRYYWRSSDRRAPHNLYTGKKRIEEYLDKLIGQEYQERFSFQKVSFIKPDDKTADFIRLPYWGGTFVTYRYNSQENQYYRYAGAKEIPHLLDNNKQITANNIIIQFARTRQQDAVGRLDIDLETGGKTLVFSDGIVTEGYWEKDEDGFTKYYNNMGERIKLNPGQTWIEIIPDSIEIKYMDTSLKDSDVKDSDMKDSDMKDSDVKDSDVKDSDKEDENIVKASIIENKWFE